MSMWKTEQPEHLPDSYKKLECCATCTKVYMKEETDETQYHCTLGAEERPLCPGCFSEEIPMPETEEQWDSFHKAQDVWDEWADKYCVEAWGYCPQHEQPKQPAHDCGEDG